MRAEITAMSSRTDLTEADFQELILERERCIAQDDELEYARCLLVLAHVVKWVRSDNSQPPLCASPFLGHGGAVIF